jgi:hypothetical protein
MQNLLQKVRDSTKICSVSLLMFGHAAALATLELAMSQKDTKLIPRWLKILVIRTMGTAAMPSAKGM